LLFSLSFFRVSFVPWRLAPPGPFSLQPLFFGFVERIFQRPFFSFPPTVEEHLSPPLMVFCWLLMPLTDRAFFALFAIGPAFSP